MPPHNYSNIMMNYSTTKKRNATKIFEMALNNNDLEMLVSFDKYKIISKTNVSKMLDLASAKGAVDFSAYLLNCRK